MEVVLFDLNGTLINDAEICWKGIEATFRAFGKEPPAMAEYFQKLAAANGKFLEIYRSVGITASIDELNKVYDLFYQSHIQEITLIPNVKGTLESLNRRQIIMGLITSQREFLVSPLLKKFGINHLFSYREFNATNKIEIIRQIIKKEGIKPQQCCFVGDLPSDILQGKEARVVTIAFLNSYWPEGIITTANPDAVMEDFKDLPGIFSKIGCKKRS